MVCFLVFLLQEYDLGQLHRGLDNRPEVFCTDVFPTVQSRPCYRLQLQANEEIGKVIEDVSDVTFYLLDLQYLYKNIFGIEVWKDLQNISFIVYL